ncbi:hypothetical protein LMG7974_01577 [Campylobacter majalis]|uniref:Uncharacterized protein n=1 Tax=Campylobacter majalis TaxID=2790656 RepID=A0ABM8Q9I2_9BACT|nr:hypothetical protein [Campylobacter majalis]CAD7289500.1 hypothetical protein LMG7974_01577 [Campylobacter majalis]
MNIFKILILFFISSIISFANDNAIGSSAGTELIATAFTFGTAGFAFASLPFLFVLVGGLIKANSGHNTHSSNITGVMFLAFLVHLCSCVFFMVCIKLLDILGALGKGVNYFSSKIFKIFWTRGESSVFSLAGASGSIEDKGAYLQLFMVQTIIDWVIILTPIMVFFTAFAYGMMGAKKDQIHTNVLQIITWCAVANIFGYFVYFLWSYIASLALFIPDGATIISKTIEYYSEIVSK